MQFNTKMEEGFIDYQQDSFYDDLDLPEYYVNQENASTFFERESQSLIPLLFDACKKGIEEDLLNIPVFRLFVISEPNTFNINALPYVTMVIKRDSFEITLQKCLEYYESKEEYEKCQDCVNLIKKFNSENI